MLIIFQIALRECKFQFPLSEDVEQNSPSASTVLLSIFEQGTASMERFSAFSATSFTHELHSVLQQGQIKKHF